MPQPPPMRRGTARDADAAPRAHRRAPRAPRVRRRLPRCARRRETRRSGRAAGLTFFDARSSRKQCVPAASPGGARRPRLGSRRARVRVRRASCCGTSTGRASLATLSGPSAGATSSTRRRAPRVSPCDVCVTYRSEKSVARRRRGVPLLVFQSYYCIQESGGEGVKRGFG